MDGNDTLWLVINGASGSNDPATLDALLTALTAAGRAPARIVDAAAEDLPDRAALELTGVATFAVFTGDGTLNAAIARLEGWSGEVLVLPGGTSNLLACALHDNADSVAIVSRFASGTLIRQRCKCIRFAQGTALSEVLAGPGAMWTDVREGLREGDLTGTANKAVEAVQQSTGGPRVVLVEPARGSPEGYAGVRLTPSPSGMTIDGYGAQSAVDLLRQGLALLRRDFREGPHDELGTHPTAVCRSLDGSPIELMIDGERRTGGAEERFSLASLDVDLLGSPGV